MGHVTTTPCHYLGSGDILETTVTRQEDRFLLPQFYCFFVVEGAWNWKQELPLP